MLALCGISPTQSSSREHIPPVPEVWKVMANPKTQGTAGPAEPQMCCKEQLRSVAPAQMCLAKKCEEMKDPQVQSPGGKLQWEHGGPTV